MTIKATYICHSNFKSINLQKNEKVLALVMAAGMFSMVACGPSAEEKQKMEEATKAAQDSIEAAAQQAASAAEQAAQVVDSTAHAVVDSAAAAVTQ